MIVTKVFKSGNSYAVRLPKGFHLDVDEVEIFQRNKEIIIREIPKNLSAAFEILTHLSDDFMSEGRNDLRPQERDFN